MKIRKTVKNENEKDGKTWNINIHIVKKYVVYLINYAIMVIQVYYQCIKVCDDSYTT